MEAFFLEHEGYFGALGAFLESAFGDRIDEVLLSAAKKYGDPNDKEHEGEALRFVSNSKQRKNSVSAPMGPTDEAAPPSAPQSISPSPSPVLPSSSASSPTPKKKSWRELFQSQRSDVVSPPPPLRRLRTQSLDSHDINLTPQSQPPVMGSLPPLSSPQTSE
jgi:hypothetical protein